MLRSLYIKDFILVDELSLDFNNDFCVFTGETGAGKSIIIDAISLLCGARANSSYIRNGKEKTLIEGVFSLNDTQKALMEELGFDTEEDAILSREIRMEGSKSIFRLNHRIINAQIAQDVFGNYIDIHSQHDNQYLLKKQCHIDLLDQYTKSSHLKTTEACFNEYHKALRALETFKNEKYNMQDLDYLHYVIKEIDNADLKENEEDELKESEKEYLSLKENFDQFNQIKEIYDRSLQDDLYTLKNLFKNISVNHLNERITDAIFEIEDSIEQLKDQNKKYDLEAFDIDSIEERLFEIGKLKHKYGTSISAILSFRNECQCKIDAIENRTAMLNEKEAEVKQALDKYNKAAALLTEDRKSGSLSLEKEIMKHLHDLMLPHAQFKVSFEEGNPSKKGSDKVEFLISMNAGESLKSLSKVASGGELSRLMLGLKVIFTHLAHVETVIFDEIDTGVSGAVAKAIGLKMKQLSKETQVMAISHLPVVIACASSHVKVSKTVNNGITTSNIKILTNEERIREIAYISTGEISNASIASARELLNNVKDQNG